MSREAGGWRSVLGRALSVLLPRRARRLAAEGFTLDLDTHLNAFDRLIREAMLQKAARQHDASTLMEYHRNYWSRRGKEFYDYAKQKDVFRRSFRERNAYVIDLLAERIGDTGRYSTLCEIGCGAGEVLHYCAEKLPHLQRFVGLDLNEEQIRENQTATSGGSIEFHAAEARAWIEANAQPGWVFLTQGGVLEYFTERDVAELLRFIAANLAPAIFVAIEPIGVGHDLDREPGSQVYGREFSFSHNYPRLFREAGFEVWHFATEAHTPWNSMAILCATVGGAGE